MKTNKKWLNKATQLCAELGPVNTNRMVTVAPDNTPIKARGAWFGHSK